MARILNSSFTAPGDETPVYSDWATVGSATVLNAAVVVSNDQAPDLWVQWSDDTSGPEPEDVDVFAAAGDEPNHHYKVTATLEPTAAYVRIKAIAYGVDANCRATIDT